MEFDTDDNVRINTPGESHHNRTGTVVRKFESGALLVDLGDVQWRYFPIELEAAAPQTETVTTAI